MDLLIKGRRALVTGASLGIGRAVAEELAREGCDVALVARTEDTLRQAADDIARQTGQRVVAVPADASLPEAVVSAVERATQALGGPIDILVNNAGSTRKTARRVISTNGILGCAEAIATRDFPAGVAGDAAPKWAASSM